MPRSDRIELTVFRIYSSIYDGGLNHFTHATVSIIYQIIAQHQSR